MNGYIQQQPLAVRLGFVASCIEFVATELKQTYREVYWRMKRAGLLSQYIYEFYDMLHTQSRERLHNEATGLYLMSDLYIVDEFMSEMQGKQQNVLYIIFSV